MDLNLDYLRQWIGQEQQNEEILTSTLVRQFNATFDRSSSTESGDVAPLLIHFCLTQPITAESKLGSDGHPSRGGFLPPVPLPRRMWAGGSFKFHTDIHIGETISRHSKIKDVVLKQGRTGQLCFVTVGHEISSGGRTVLIERQDIVYRDASGVDAAKTAPKQAPKGSHSRQIEPTAPLLFRYSAMTFNSHRIHYDNPYATKVEGYPGLMVHGPMQATLLCQMAADLRGTTPKTFNFRSLSPLFNTSDFTVNASDQSEGMKLWTARLGGPIAMEANAQW